MEASIFELFSRILYILPHIAVWITAIVICLQFQKHSQRETMYLSIGFGILIVDIFVTNILQIWLVNNSGQFNLQLSTLFSLLHFGGIVINLIAWGFILTGMYQLLQRIQTSKETNQ